MCKYIGFEIGYKKTITSIGQKDLRRIIVVSLFAGLAFVSAAYLAAQHDQDRAIVVAGGNIVFCRIVAGSEDKIAAKSLQDYLRKHFKITADIVEPGYAPGGSQACEILLGTQQTNPYLAQMAKKHNIEIGVESLTEDGYVLRTLRRRQRDVVLAAGGGRRGVFYAVGELKNYYLRQRGDSVVVLPAAVREVPALKYRWFWTWDWRMQWGGSEPGGAEMGGGGPYRKKTTSFLADYKRCIDYMAENGFNGLIIWGFLRDSHGGIGAAQELCRYAAERGVRVLPGVGTSGYGGYYYQGNHLYNTGTWIERHPELRRVGKQGEISDGLGGRGPCPSKKANQDWLDEGAKWLFENFRIGGVNLEMGDLFVCYCDDCKRARAAIKSDEPDYYKDMAISHSITLKTMRQLDPDAWLTYSTYTGFTREMMAKPPKFIEIIPSDAICMWTLTKMLDQKHDTISDPMVGTKGGWPANVKPVSKHSTGYLHWANKSTHTEHDFFLERLRTAAARAQRADMEGLGIYGELPSSWPNMELNYLAFREFCFHPDLSLEEFTKKRLAPLYGKDLTAELWKVINLTRLAEQRKSGENISRALAIAHSALDCASANARRHWEGMVAYLESFQY